jgi:hypothetical protein
MPVHFSMPEIGKNRFERKNVAMDICEDRNSHHDSISCPLARPRIRGFTVNRANRPNMAANMSRSVVCLPVVNSCGRHHLSAAVWTGSSQRAANRSSSSDMVIEQPAISSEVTREPTSERATVSPRFSKMRLAALYMR